LVGWLVGWLVVLALVVLMVVLAVLPPQIRLTLALREACSIAVVMGQRQEFQHSHSRQHWQPTPEH